MHTLHPLLPALPPWLRFSCPYLVVWGTLLAFKSISSMGINKVELNMSWSRYEDVKAVWHLFSHSEMKYNVLILNASDRINRNDLRFPPREFCTKPPLDTHRMLAHTQTPVVGAVIDVVGVVKAGEHSSNLLIQKHNLCSLASAVRCGKTVQSLSVSCIGSEGKGNNMLYVAFLDD